MLTIKVEAGAGEDVRDIIEEMCLLAARVNCLVYAKLNEVTTMAKPGSDPRHLYELWESEMDSKRQYKVVCAQPVTIPRDKPWDGNGVGKTSEHQK